MLQNSTSSKAMDGKDQHLKSEVQYIKDIQEICSKIYAASNVDEILVDLKDEITNIFAAERITVYVSTGKNGS